MNSSRLRELTLYRYRYVLGYGLFICLLIGLITVDIGSIPYGVSESEMRSAVASNSLNPVKPTVSDIVNLPYHALQKLSISVLGLSTFSIRLPSIILGLISGVILATMLHIWFRRNVAILALLIATASVPFISAARTGTPGIIYTLLLLTILLGAIKLTISKKSMFRWKLAVFVSALLLLYVPFGIYALIALGLAGIFHPHIRYQIKKTNAWQAIVLAAVGSVLLAPLVIAGIYETGVLSQLFGFDQLGKNLAPSALMATSISLLKTLVVFTKVNVSETITPFLNFTFLMFIAFGFAKVIFDWHAARSYMLLIWLGFSIPMIYIDPTQLPLIFVPCVLLMSIGIETFISEWYRLFPRNPYARLAAFIPLSLIVVGLITIATSRYFYAYAYTDTRPIFNPEITAISSVLNQKPAQLVVPSNHVGFYDILRRGYPELTVVTPDQITPSARRIVLASVDAGNNGIPSKIIATHTKSSGVLLRVYAAK